MNELVLAGGTIAALWGITQAQTGVTQEEHAGRAITIAMQTLLASRPLAATSWAQDAQRPLSATANFAQMKAALGGHYGTTPNAGSSFAVHDVPVLTNDQLVEIATKWLRAYDAGRAADPRNFQFTTSEAADTLFGTGCADTNESQRTSLGSAACALASYRDQLDSGAASTAFTDSGETAAQTMNLVNRLATEMDAADYTIDGVRNSDAGWAWGDIPGGVLAAGSASVDFVEGLAGDAVKAVGGEIVGSDLFWLAVIGFAGYMVLR